MVGQIYRSHTTPAFGTAQTPPIYNLASRSPAPEVMYIRTIAELDAALNGFNGPYGFDCEWKCMPQDSRVALVPLSNGSKILLVQVSAMPEFPAQLKDILEDPSVVKVGHAIEGDGASLRDDYGVNAQNLYNIAPIAMRIDPTFKQRFSTCRFLTVAHVVDHSLKRTLPKDPVRTSNWERVPLTEAQREYAAGDAHCVYEIYILLLARVASARINLQYCGKILVQSYHKPSFPDSFPIERFVVPAGLSKKEFGAYTMWDQGYSTADIQVTMERHCHAPPNDIESVIYVDPHCAFRSMSAHRRCRSPVVNALKKNTTPSYVPMALRAVVESSPTAYSEHKTLVDARCSIITPSISDAEASFAASGSVRSTPEPDTEPRDEALKTNSSLSPQQAETKKRAREDEERETTPEGAPPLRPNKRCASFLKPSEWAVKRSRTV